MALHELINKNLQHTVVLEHKDIFMNVGNILLTIHFPLYRQTEQNTMMLFYVPQKKVSK